MTSGVYFSPGDMVRRFSFSGRGNVNGWVLGTVLARRERMIGRTEPYAEIEYLVLSDARVEWIYSAYVTHLPEDPWSV